MGSRFLLRTSLVFAIVFVARSAQAKDLFVDNVAGDDHWDGRSPAAISAGAGPVRTLNQALWLADAGDRISMAKTDEPYREAVSLHGDKHSGLPSNLFIIEGNGATLDGSAPVPGDGWQYDHDDTFRFRPERLAYQQLFLNGRPAVRKNPTSSAGLLPALKPLEWTLVGGQIYFRIEAGKLPDQYPLTYARQPVGLTLYKVQNVRINNLVVQGFQLDGINLNDVAGGTVLSGITARGNGRSGIAVCGASQVVVEACLAGDNGESQLHLEGPSATNIVNCDLVPSSGPKWLKDDFSRVYVDGQEPTAAR